MQFWIGLTIVLALAVWIVHRVSQKKDLFLPGLVMGNVTGFASNPCRVGMMVGCVAAIVIIVIALWRARKKEK